MSAPRPTEDTSTTLEASPVENTFKSLQEVISNIGAIVGKMETDAADAKKIGNVPDNATFLPKNEFNDTKLKSDMEVITKDFKDISSGLAAGGDLVGMADNKDYQASLEAIGKLDIQIRTCFTAALHRSTPNLAEIKETFAVALTALDKVKEPTDPERSDSEQKAVEDFVDKQKAALKTIQDKTLLDQMKQVEQSLQNQRTNNFAMLQAYQLNLAGIKINSLWKEWADDTKDLGDSPLVLGIVGPHNTIEMERRIKEMQKNLEGHVFKREGSPYSIHCKENGGIRIMPYAKNAADFQASMEEGIKFLKIRTKPELTSVELTFPGRSSREIKIDEVKAFINAVTKAGLKVDYPLASNIRGAIIKAGPKEEEIIKKMIQDAEAAYEKRIEDKKKGEGPPEAIAALEQKAIGEVLDSRIEDLKKGQDARKKTDVSSLLEDVLGAKPSGEANLRQLLDVEVKSLNERMQRVDSAYAQIDAIRKGGQIPDEHKEKVQALINRLDNEVKDIQARQQILNASSDNAVKANEELNGLSGKLEAAVEYAKRTNAALEQYNEERKKDVSGPMVNNEIPAKRDKLTDEKKAADAAVVVAQSAMDAALGGKKPSNALAKLNGRPEFKNIGERADKLAGNINKARENLEKKEVLAPRSLRPT